MSEIPPKDRLYNLTSLINLSKGNIEFMEKMVSIFIEQSTDTIEKASIAISQNDFIEVSRLVHRIKPSVETLGIISIISELKLLEKIQNETLDKEQIKALFGVIKEVLEKAIIQLKEDKIEN